MKIAKSSTVIWFERRGLSSASGTSRKSGGKALYGASGFGSGGQAKSGKARKSPKKTVAKKRK